jgi:hypothetical protein
MVLPLCPKDSRMKIKGNLGYPRHNLDISQCVIQKGESDTLGLPITFVSQNIENTMKQKSSPFDSMVVMCEGPEKGSIPSAAGLGFNCTNKI